MQRCAGILLHPSSLPGPGGIGDIGQSAFGFIDWLASAGQKLWQVLPLGPTGYGDSPYASFSAFAGNPLLISLSDLRDEGWLQADDLNDSPDFLSDKVDYGRLIPWKTAILERAADRFLSKADNKQLSRRQAFIRAEDWWLDDYSLFMDIKAVYDDKARGEGKSGAMWSNYWPEDLALRRVPAIDEWRRQSDHEAAIERQKTIQFFFFSQWERLRSHAREKGIALVGDIPFFVAADSVDVWAHRDLYRLDDRGQPLAVAGVPPDYFSATGQLWGNPLYDWAKHRKANFQWWIKRVKSQLAMVDWIRIDHFRGFEANWSVPFGRPDAVIGQWDKGPGHSLFTALKAELGELPILAEDLGFITPEVRALRDDFVLPGMRILQFGFDAKESSGGIDPANNFLPHMYERDCVVYSGTHDNDTLRGWLDKAGDEELRFVRDYLAVRGRPDELVKPLLRAALASVAAFAILPMQDILGLSTEARMNTPSTIGGNWTWRIAEAPNAETAGELREWCRLYAR